MKAFSGTFFKKICFHGFLFFGIWLFWGISSEVQAGSTSSGLTYTGRILDAKEIPVTASSVIFTITVYDSAGKCWLYTEQRNLDLSQTAGTFSFEIGSSDASTLYGAAPSYNNQSSGGAKDLAELFSNRRAFTGLGTANGCTGSYDPSTATDPNEGRLLSVYFRIGASGTDQAIPPMRVTPVPMAMQALSLNGYGAGELLRVASSVDKNTNSNSDLNQTQYDEFWRLLKNPLGAYLPVSGDVTLVSGNNKVTALLGQALPAGPAANGQVLVSNGTSWVLGSLSTGSVTSVSATAPVSVGGTASAPIISLSAATTSANGYLTSGDWNIFNSKQTSSLSSGKIWVGNASNVSAEVSLSGDATMDNAGVLTLKNTGTAGTYGSASLVPVITTDAKGRVTSITTAAPLDATKLPLAGGTMTGTLNMGGQDITNAGNISMAASKTLGLSSNATDPASPTAGQVWYNSTSNLIKFYDGSAVQALGVAGAGITSLNGLTSGAQTFAIGTSGTAPAFSSATSTHTLNIPLASTAGVTAGLISKADYDTFNTKLGAINNTAILTATKVWIGNASGVAQEFALSGDATMTSGGVVTVDKTQAAAASKILQLDASSVAVTKGEDIGGASTGKVSLRYPSTATNTTLTFPNSAGSASQFLQTDGSGNLTWATPAAILPSLASTQVWVGNASGAAAPVSLSGDISSITNAGAVTANKTTTAQANKLLALDGTGVAASMGNQLNGTTSGSVTLQAAAAITNYSLTFPAAQGGSGQTLSNNGTGVLSWASTLTNTLTSGKIWVGNASNVSAEVSLSGDATMDNAGVLTLKNTGTAGTYGSASLVPVITTDAQGRVTGVTTAAPLDATKLPLAGGTMTGAINMGAQDITNAGNISMAASKTLGLSSNAADPGTPTAGQVWYNSTSNVIKYYDGTSVQALGVAGAGITSLNGLTSGAQTFAIGTSGTAPAFSSATSTHTLNIPLASTAGVTAGLISKADYDTFNTKLGAISNTASLAATKVWIGNASGVAQEFALSGDATMTSGGVVTVDKTQAAAASKILQLTANSVAVTKGTDIGGAGTGVAHLLYPNTATNTTLTFPNSAGSASQFLQTDGAGNLSWSSPSPTLPGLASTQVWVGNASGAAAAVSLSGDISSITNAGVVTANKTTTAQANKLLALDGTGVAATMGNQLNGITSGSVTLQASAVTTNYSLTFPAAQGSSGQTLSNNGSGVLSWITPLTSSTGFINGGNSFGADSSLGNSDNFNLNFITNNSSRMTILNNGRVGVGTTNPTLPFVVHSGGGWNFSGTAYAVGEFDAPSSDRGIELGYDSTGNIGVIAADNGTVDSQIAFYTANSSGVFGEKVRINGAGNVGIGTSNPTLNASGKILHINESSTGAAAIHFTNNTTAATATDGFAIGKWVDGQYGDGPILWNYEATPMVFGTNSIERMRIDASGNVGIGETNPLGKLDVKDSATLVSNGTGASIYLHNSVSTNGDYLGMGWVGQGIWGMMAADANAYKTLSLQPFGGNVGIGTTNPSSTLHVSGSTTLAGGNFQFSDTGVLDSTAVRVFSNGGNLYLQNGSGGGTYIRNKTATSVLTVLDSGNVGIGTASPSSVLTVDGGAGVLSLKAGSSADHVYLQLFARSASPNTRSGYLGYPGAGSNDIRLFNEISGGNISLMTTGAGNVGIGTPSPSGKLHIQGDNGSGLSLILTPTTIGNHVVLIPPANDGSVAFGVTNTTNTAWEAYMLNNGTVGYVTLANLSDRRLKKDIQPLAQGVNEILKLDSVEYHWINKDISKERQIGFIAQEVEKIFPELVSEGPDGYKRVNYVGIIPVLVNAVKELNTKISDLIKNSDDHSRSIASLQLDTQENKSSLEQLKAENEQLKNENALIKSYICGKDPSAPICR